MSAASASMTIYKQVAKSLIVQYSSQQLIRQSLFVKTLSRLYRNKTNNMASSRWVYASGSHWIRFDSTTSREIERMFVKGGAGWVNIRAFGGQVYVNAIGCYVCANSGLRFTIARMLE
jgi:hypothetical protein